LKAAALLDSNVLIAILVVEHQHHAASLNLLIDEGGAVFAVAAHSYAEAYSTLTRKGENGPYRFAPADAWTALEGLRSLTDLVGLTPAQTLGAVRRYAESGGIGARLYDALIGEAATMHEIPAIISWNVRHMRSLFPRLNVMNPTEFSAARTSAR